MGWIWRIIPALFIHGAQAFGCWLGWVTVKKGFAYGFDKFLLFAIPLAVLFGLSTVCQQPACIDNVGEGA